MTTAGSLSEGLALAADPGQALAADPCLNDTATGVVSDMQTPAGDDWCYGKPLFASGAFHLASWSAHLHHGR